MALATSRMCQFFRLTTPFYWGLCRQVNSRRIPFCRRYVVKASYMSIGCLFDFRFELLKVWEHFTLLPNREDPGVPREVDDKCDVVPASTEGCHLGWSPHIWIYYIYVSREWTFDLLFFLGRWGNLPFQWSNLRDWTGLACLADHILRYNWNMQNVLDVRWLRSLPNETLLTCRIGCAVSSPISA